MTKVTPAGEVGVRGVGTAPETSAALKALRSTKCKTKPGQARYGLLETGEFWTCVGEKKGEARLFTHVIGMREKRRRLHGGGGGLRTARKLGERVMRLGASHGVAAADGRGGVREGGKGRAAGREGGDRRLRRRIRRASRRACRFSKTMALSNAHHTLWITFKRTYTKYKIKVYNNPTI
ncbi:MAG: hypothetical protein LBD58_06620 [Treponema sp.]|nr:hypothetical protein [Treponema sp.]